MEENYQIETKCIQSDNSLPSFLLLYTICNILLENTCIYLSLSLINAGISFIPPSCDILPVHHHLRLRSLRFSGYLSGLHLLSE